MGLELTGCAIRNQMQSFFAEDDLSRHMTYISSLPSESVECFLMIKSDLYLAGAPWFVEAFRYLGASSFDPEALWRKEGTLIAKESKIELGRLPFSLAVTGERVALNLLQRASSIATFTRLLVDKAEKYGVSILDTRKTTPGLRSLEKYAVHRGGGENHRLGQTDMWMVKDNHKVFFGGMSQAVGFFRDLKGFYTPLLVEVHSLEEIQEAKALGVKHIMLDNFTPQMVREAIKDKPKNMTFEVSGGITSHNIEDYLMEGLDAISLGVLTYAPPPVDFSFKYQRVE